MGPRGGLDQELSSVETPLNRRDASHSAPFCVEPELFPVMEDCSSANTAVDSVMWPHDDFSLPYTNIRRAAYMDLHYVFTLGFTSLTPMGFPEQFHIFSSEASLLCCWL